jgi:hypothetical protein
MNGHMTGQNEGLPLGEVAKRLGISNDALRKRISRDSGIHTYKRGRQVFVVIPDMRPDQADSRPEPSANDRTATGPSDDTAMQRLIAHLETENAKLWAEVDARRREVEELHILLQREQARTLPAPRESMSDGHTSDIPHGAESELEPEPAQPEQRRSWWRFWRG